MAAAQIQPGIKDALIVVDVQNDFCPGGRLAVQKGDEVVPLVNALAAHFENVVLTQDWHPPGHQSFATAHPGSKPFDSVKLAYGEQVLWPDKFFGQRQPPTLVHLDGLDDYRKPDDWKLIEENTIGALREIGVPVTAWIGAGSLDQVLRDMTIMATAPRIGVR